MQFELICTISFCFAIMVWALYLSMKNAPQCVCMHSVRVKAKNPWRKWATWEQTKEENKNGKSCENTHWNGV